MRLSITLTAFAILILTSTINAQQPAPRAITIAEAVDSALKTYPSISVSQEQINAAATAIDLARTSYLPRIDTLATVNRATRNNVFGLLLPQSVIPSISGPVLGTNNAESVWGSAIGALVTWEPFDFGLRSANVSAATAAKAHSEASSKRTQLEVAVATADAYLTLVAAEETIQAAQAGVDRSQVLARIVRAQVDAQLRPGADASRAQAELATAQTQLARAQQAADVARAVLGQFVGGDPRQIKTVTSKLLTLPDEQAPIALVPLKNPIAAEQNAVVDQKKAELQALQKTYYPKFSLQGSAYARGTGAVTDGSTLGGFNGLATSTQNYAVGFSVTFPIFDFKSIGARKAGQTATIRVETAKNDQVTSDLTARWNTAVATLEGARRIAANTPIQVSAAQDASQQATARYQAGLGTIVEVADAQRLLSQSQIDDSLSRLAVWRAQLAVAAADGDIQAFLAGASQ
jgi:outer membrane protein TolC